MAMRRTLSRRMLAATATCLTALTACERAREVDAPPPASTADVDSLPSLPISELDVPLTYDLTPLVADLEDAVPKSFGDLNEQHTSPDNKRVRFAFAAQRDPFKVTLDGQTARMRAIIDYAGRGCYAPPVGPTVSASCGASGQRPRAVIEISSDLSLTPDWHLRGKTRVDRVAAYSETDADQC